MLFIKHALVLLLWLYYMEKIMKFVLVFLFFNYLSLCVFAQDIKNVEINLEEPRTCLWLSLFGDSSNNCSGWIEHKPQSKKEFMDLMISRKIPERPYIRAERIYTKKKLLETYTEEELQEPVSSLVLYDDYWKRQFGNPEFFKPVKTKFTDSDFKELTGLEVFPGASYQNGKDLKNNNAELKTKSKNKNFISNVFKNLKNIFLSQKDIKEIEATAIDPKKFSSIQSNTDLLERNHDNEILMTADGGQSIVSLSLSDVVIELESPKDYLTLLKYHLENTFEQSVTKLENQNKPEKFYAISSGFYSDILVAEIVKSIDDELVQKALVEIFRPYFFKANNENDYVLPGVKRSFSDLYSFFPALNEVISLLIYPETDMSKFTELYLDPDMSIIRTKTIRNASINSRRVQKTDYFHFKYNVDDIESYQSELRSIKTNLEDLFIQAEDILTSELSLTDGESDSFSKDSLPGFNYTYSKKFAELLFSELLSQSLQSSDQDSAGSSGKKQSLKLNSEILVVNLISEYLDVNIFKAKEYLVNRQNKANENKEVYLNQESLSELYAAIDEQSLIDPLREILSDLFASYLKSDFVETESASSMFYDVTFLPYEYHEMAKNIFSLNDLVEILNDSLNKIKNESSVLSQSHLLKYRIALIHFYGFCHQGKFSALEEYLENRIRLCSENSFEPNNFKLTSANLNEAEFEHFVKKSFDEWMNQTSNFASYGFLFNLSFPNYMNPEKIEAQPYLSSLFDEWSTLSLSEDIVKRTEANKYLKFIEDKLQLISEGFHHDILRLFPEEYYGASKNMESIIEALVSGEIKGVAKLTNDSAFNRRVNSFHESLKPLFADNGYLSLILEKYNNDTASMKHLPSYTKSLNLEPVFEKIGSLASLVELALPLYGVKADIYIPTTHELILSDLALNKVLMNHLIVINKNKKESFETLNQLKLDILEQEDSLERYYRLQNVITKKDFFINGVNVSAGAVQNAIKREKISLNNMNKDFQDRQSGLRRSGFYNEEFLLDIFFRHTYAKPSDFEAHTYFGEYFGESIAQVIDVLENEIKDLEKAGYSMTSLGPSILDLEEAKNLYNDLKSQYYDVEAKSYPNNSYDQVEAEESTDDSYLEHFVINRDFSLSASYKKIQLDTERKFYKIYFSIIKARLSLVKSVEKDSAGFYFDENMMWFNDQFPVECLVFCAPGFSELSKIMIGIWSMRSKMLVWNSVIHTDSSFISELITEVISSFPEMLMSKDDELKDEINYVFMRPNGMIHTMLTRGKYTGNQIYRNFESVRLVNNLILNTFFVPLSVDDKE